MSTNSIKPCSKQVTLKKNNGECGSHRVKQFCELLTGISRGSNTSFTEITKHAPTRIGNNWSVGPQAIMDVAKKTKLERTNQCRSQKKKNLVWIVSLFSVIFNFRKSYTWFSQPLLALRVAPIRAIKKSDCWNANAASTSRCQWALYVKLEANWSANRPGQNVKCRHACCQIDPNTGSQQRSI